MKPSFVVSIALSLVLVAGIGYLSFGRGDIQTPREDPHAETLARLEERLAAIEGRLADFDRLEAVVGTLKSRRPVAPAAPARDAGESAAAGESEDAAVEDPPESDAIVALSETPKLDSWLEKEGLREEMESFVAQVYLDTRTKRKDRERLEAEERQRELAAMSEGPYGEHNFRVNSLAKKLDLDEQQKDYYNELLTKYEERRKSAMESITPPQPGEGGAVNHAAMRQHLEMLAQTQKDLAQQFDDEFLRGLTAEQQDAYLALPPHERGGGGGGQVFSFGGGNGMVRYATRAFVDSSAVLDDVKLAVPPPQVK